MSFETAVTAGTTALRQTGLRFPVDESVIAESVLRAAGPELATVTAEDAELAHAIRALSWRALAKAEEVLEEGTPASQLQIIKVVYARLAGLISGESPAAFDEMKQELTKMLAEVRT